MSPVRPVTTAALATAVPSDVATYVYRGAEVPKPGDERVRLNLWLFGGAAPTNAQPVEIVVESLPYAP